MPEDAPMMTAVRVESLVMSTRNGVLKMRGMAMGKRKPERQPTMWMATTELRTAAVEGMIKIRVITLANTR
jgi:hypothetical protein